MSDYTKSSPRRKQDFYARPEIADGYDDQRFGGASGAWVSARELELVVSLLPPFHRALDLGCGTGRLTRVLAECGPTVGLDTSAAMLAQAGKKSGAALVQGDALAPPFGDASFDAITALRLVFHYADLNTLLHQAARMLAPHGTCIFDTYLRSPRAFKPLDPARWGDGVFIHPPELMDEAARRAGLRVTRRKHCFLFSPYVYRRLPLTLVHLLARVEPHVPPRLRARVFWALERGNSS